MKYCTILLIAAMLMVFPIAQGIAYERMSEGEVLNWIDSITIDDLINFIIKYDYVEHAEPEVEVPEYTILHIGNRLRLHPTGPMFFSVGHLEYKIEMPVHEAPWNPQENSNGIWWLLGGIIAGAGAATAIFLVAR